MLANRRLAHTPFYTQLLRTYLLLHLNLEGMWLAKLETGPVGYSRGVNLYELIPNEFEKLWSICKAGQSHFF